MESNVRKYEFLQIRRELRITNSVNKEVLNNLPVKDL